MRNQTALSQMLPPVQQWFQEELGEPTPAQEQGWPLIASGRHTLILAPTGSGKTLAAFLACLDHLWRQPKLSLDVHVLYISPLKALNNDIHRNLQVPLEGVAQTAKDMAQDLVPLTTAVRTGDTPTSERQKLARTPPHILITTPESLHLLLTSKARETLRKVKFCIVDEIHSLCSNKRGVFLSLLLERLEAIQREPDRIVRIGLSATQRPLEEVARYLGGAQWQQSGELAPRPVAIVDAGLRKDLDLQVISPVERFGPLPEKSIWPSIYQTLSEHVAAHRSTLIFANNRRAVERITACINEEEEIARAHHGSVALEIRHQIEAALKEGRIPAVVSTASLEMGIDMGAVDLVCQVESPGNVARALQRVGRAGHLVGQKSKGRLIPKTPNDLLEQAVLAREMASGNVEAIAVPINCLDVLAQQVVAMTAMDTWDVQQMWKVVRQAYPYRDLTSQAFESVVEMVSGRYSFKDEQAPLGKTVESLQPRISWDRVHQRLVALPGSQQIALINGGTIPDTGQYLACTSNGTRIGELDEEFIYERRVGDVFLLGTNAWRVAEIESDRVIVAPAEGAPAMVPFWRGEGLGRAHDLGMAIGQFLHDFQEKVTAADCLPWLQKNYFLDKNAAKNLLFHVKRQLEGTGALPTHRSLIVEASRDQLGDWQVILLSPFGSRLHFALRLALEHTLRKRLGYRPQCLHHDDGIFLRLTDSDEPYLDLFDTLTPENVEQRILEELAESALFALRFRQNAARAMLMPRGKPGQRAPLWLQRMRGRDLLQVVRQHPDFPVVVETYRECLQDHLDVPRLRALLEQIRDGEIQVIKQRREVPSPFAANLVFSFTAAQMYQYDEVESDKSSSVPLDQTLLQQLIQPESHEHLLDPRAIQQVEKRLRGLGQPPRSTAEMAEWLRRLGDLTPSELEGPMEAFLLDLETDGIAQRIDLPETREPQRWVLTEEVEQYQRAFTSLEDSAAEEIHDAAKRILARFLSTHALVGLQDILDRYPFERSWAERQLQHWSGSGRLAQIEPVEDSEPTLWASPDNLEQIQRGSLGLLRREVITGSPQQLADFLVRWQHAHPELRSHGPEGMANVLRSLQGIYLPLELWEKQVLPLRVGDCQPRWLEEWLSGGNGIQVAQRGAERVTFFEREHVLESPPPSQEASSENAAMDAVLEHLRQRGASFVADIAQLTGLAPGTVRTALWSLLDQGLVTNDHLDVLRQGRDALLGLVEESRPSRQRGRGVTRSLSRRRASGGFRPEGRWSLIPWNLTLTSEQQAIAMASRLLTRYGFLAREISLLDPTAMSWRILYEVLTQMELAGEVRRGYFFEGLSGAQFALPEAIEMLQEIQLPSNAAAPILLLHSLDPANLYGSGAPFDIPLLDNGTRSFLRRAGNWIALRAGRPVLLAEQQGKHITALPTASRQEIKDAVLALPSLCEANGNYRYKLTVEVWNSEPVTSTEGRELLEEAGFVRDYQAMTLHAVWK